MKAEWCCCKTYSKGKEYILVKTRHNEALDKEASQAGTLPDIRLHFL